MLIQLASVRTGWALLLCSVDSAALPLLQRDEIGLLSNLDLYGGSPTSSLDHEEALQEQQGQQAVDCSCSRPCGVRPGAASDAQAAAEQLALQYGRSPDSDDCSVHTGRQLMRVYCDSSDSMPGSSRALPGADGRDAAAAEGASAAAEGASATRSLPQAELAAEAEQRQQQQQLAACLQQQQHAPGRQPLASASAEEAYTRPEHAQVAALLGQPVYDPALGGLHTRQQPGCAAGRLQGTPAVTLAVVPSSSKPHRSPFMSDLLHHAHPPGPQEACGSAAGGEQACVRGGSGGAAGPAGSGGAAALPGCAGALVHSGEAFWVPEEEGEEALEAAAGGAADAFSSLPFSVRNAPLLRVIPKYCECSSGRSAVQRSLGAVKCSAMQPGCGAGLGQVCRQWRRSLAACLLPPCSLPAISCASLYACTVLCGCASRGRPPLCGAGRTT